MRWPLLRAKPGLRRSSRGSVVFRESAGLQSQGYEVQHNHVCGISAFSATKPGELLSIPGQSMHFCVNRVFFDGHFVTVFFVFIHIPGSIFIFNISNDFKTAFGSFVGFRGGRAASGLHHDSSLYHLTHFVKRQSGRSFPIFWSRQAARCRRGRAELGEIARF